ncbi:hypothetical protein J7355_13485 [Endozoicomonas sp. G2_2]|uniref:hypothetical protein n=1 Tax=Endozoicomonas sp. G2_2 TaxID=2821092 RepID=UPI001ADB40F7|nr:hypothetical protein [Endozoicomonas sp. G2_2]MBO9471108.1 hypothetical protein [Endozoicomonas sp. G2_2]
MGLLSIDMSHSEALRRIFAYGNVPIMGEVLTANGEPTYEPTGEYETVGFAFDWVTNRVYRVTEWSHDVEALPPVAGVCEAMDTLLHNEQSVATDLQFVSMTASVSFDPFKELD